MFASKISVNIASMVEMISFRKLMQRTQRYQSKLISPINKNQLHNLAYFKSIFRENVQTF